MSPRTGIEQAVTAVRSIVAALGGVTLLTVEATRSASDLRAPVLIAVAVALGASGLALLSRAGGADHEPGRPGSRLVWLQALDTVAFVALAALLEVYVTEAAWALLVVPIVVASLRLNDLAVVGTWVLGSVGYGVAGRLGLGADSTDYEIVIERIAVLLAVAACVALLTRWLQEGWQAQGELTSLAERRIDWLSTIEHAARSMRAAEPERVLDVCVSNAPRLGFAAATATRHGAVSCAAGAVAMVPLSANCDVSEPGGVTITRWTGSDGEVLHSASVVEPITGTIVSGWQSDTIDDAIGRALCDLVAEATGAVEAANHLVKARFEASHDPLTKLANRAGLRRSLDAATNGDKPAAVLFIDLDHFKEINDTHGHLVADHLLVALADRLTHLLNNKGVIARFGGDEFVILVTGRLATLALELAEHVRETLAEPFDIEQHAIKITASIGAAAALPPIDPEELLQHADGAAYVAKHAGRDGVHYVRVDQPESARPAEETPGHDDQIPDEDGPDEQGLDESVLDESLLNGPVINKSVGP